MSSPSTMFSGAIQLGMLSIPCTIGKASSETRESALVQVCNHNGEVIRIDRSERCSLCGGAPKNKAHAVKVDDNDYRVLEASEMEAIESATKSDVLEILDVQPLSKLPMMYALGTYYVRFNDGAKGGSMDAFAHFVAALHSERSGAIVKWGNSSNQKLSVLSVESGILLLRIIPFVADIRAASTKERFHWKVELEERKLNRMVEFLREVRDDDGFGWAAYQNEGLKMRQEAVEAVLNGEEPKQLPKMGESDGEVDWMAQLERDLDNDMAKA